MLSVDSLEKLGKCHFLLQELAVKASFYIDFTVFCTYRNEKDQNFAYFNELSKLEFPRSAHNKEPVMAFDAYPNPLNWKRISRFLKLGRIMKEEFTTICKEENLKNVELIWGGDFHSFKDYVHFELKINGD